MQPRNRFQGRLAFKMDLGYTPPHPIDPHDLEDMSMTEHTHRLSILSHQAKITWRKSHLIASEIFNAKHSTIPDTLKLRAQVLIDWTVLPTIPDKSIANLSPKLCPYYCGPFTVLCQVNDVSSELEPPPSENRCSFPRQSIEGVFFWPHCRFSCSTNRFSDFSTICRRVSFNGDHQDCWSSKGKERIQCLSWIYRWRTTIGHCVISQEVNFWPVVCICHVTSITNC